MPVHHVRCGGRGRRHPAPSRQEPYEPRLRPGGRAHPRRGHSLAPTFVAFTPWTTLDGYIALLERLLELQLVESVPPVQLCIRLLIPEGSYLLQLPGFKEQLLAVRSQAPGLSVGACRSARRRIAARPAGVGRPIRGAAPAAPRSVRRGMAAVPRGCAASGTHALPRTLDLQFRACRSLGTVAPSRPTSSCSPSEGADP